MGKKELVRRRKKRGKDWRNAYKHRRKWSQKIEGKRKWEKGPNGPKRASEGGSKRDKVGGTHTRLRSEDKRGA